MALSRLIPSLLLKNAASGFFAKEKYSRFVVDIKIKSTYSMTWLLLTLD